MYFRVFPPSQNSEFQVNEFAEWLSQTYLSVLIQNHNSWVIPTIQSIHIAGIGVVLSSVFMVDLRILGWAGMDQTLRQTTNRFGPWLTGALCALLATGLLMVIGEPVRELVTVSFWVKMLLVAVGTIVAAVFQIVDAQQGVEGQRAVCRGHLVHVVDLTVRRAPPMKRMAVPRRDPGLALDDGRCFRAWCRRRRGRRRARARRRSWARDRHRRTAPMRAARREGDECQRQSGRRHTRRSPRAPSLGGEAMTQVQPSAFSKLRAILDRLREARRSSLAVSCLVAGFTFLLR